jgi:hypothetical protein
MLQVLGERIDLLPAKPKTQVHFGGSDHAIAYLVRDKPKPWESKFHIARLPGLFSNSFRQV